MARSIPAAAARRFGSLRGDLDRREGLPFLDHLSQARVEAACRACAHQWRERTYTPWITLGVFLSQVLSDDHSCDATVDRFQKFGFDFLSPIPSR